MRVSIELNAHARVAQDEILTCVWLSSGAVGVRDVIRVLQDAARTVLPFECQHPKWLKINCPLTLNMAGKKKCLSFFIVVSKLE